MAERRDMPNRKRFMGSTCLRGGLEEADPSARRVAAAPHGNSLVASVDSAREHAAWLCTLLSCSSEIDGFDGSGPGVFTSSRFSYW